METSTAEHRMHNGQTREAFAASMRKWRRKNKAREQLRDRLRSRRAREAEDIAEIAKILAVHPDLEGMVYDD